VFGLFDFILFMVFSVMETCAMLYLMFRMFKIDLMPKEMVFASVIMAFVSYTLRAVYELPGFDVPVQLVLTLAFVWMLFRIHVFYATIMTGMVYQAYFLLQTIFYLLLKSVGIFDSPLPVVTNGGTFMLQILSAGSAVTAGMIIVRKRKGFDFVPDKPKGRIHLKRRDSILSALTLPSFTIVILTIYLTETMRVYVIINFIYAVILYGYIYLAYKRDRSDNDSISP
jgi:hypothetical protein